MTASTLPAERRMTRAEEPEWLVWALVIVLLAVGWLVRTVVESRMTQFSTSGVTLSYPTGWMTLPDSDAFQVFGAADAFAPGKAATEVRVFLVPTDEVSRMAQSLGDLAMAWSTRKAEQLLGYSILASEPTTVAGRPAVKLDYAYVIQGVGGGLPVVVRAEDILLRQADRLLVLSFSTASDLYADQLPAWQRILASLKVK